jgi:hypothetical protein
MQEDLGRRPTDEGTPHDAPSATVEKILKNQDLIIDAIVALDAANTGVPEVAALKKIVLTL